MSPTDNPHQRMSDVHDDALRELICDAEAVMDMDFAELRRWHAATGHAHASLLRWYRCVGYARHDGVQVDMHEPPAVAPDAQDITYLPGEATLRRVLVTDPASPT